MLHSTHWCRLEEVSLLFFWALLMLGSTTLSSTPIPSRDLGFINSFRTLPWAPSASLTKFIENAWPAPVGLSMKRHPRANKILCLMRYYKLLRFVNYPCLLYCSSSLEPNQYLWNTGLEDSSTPLPITIGRYSLSFKHPLPSWIYRKEHMPV